MSSLDIVIHYTPTPTYTVPEDDRYRAGVLARGIRDALAILGREEISAFTLIECYDTGTLEAAATAIEQGREVSFMHGRRSGETGHADADQGKRARHNAQSVVPDTEPLTR